MQDKPDKTAAESGENKLPERDAEEQQETSEKECAAAVSAEDATCA